MTCSECSPTAALRQLDVGRIGWNLINSANIVYCLYLESFSFYDILHISVFWVNMQNLCSALAACLHEKLLKWIDTKLVPKWALEGSVGKRNGIGSVSSNYENARYNCSRLRSCRPYVSVEEHIGTTPVHVLFSLVV